MVTRKLPYYEFADGIYEIDEFDCVSVFVIVGGIDDELGQFGRGDLLH